jgi:hypothetical protein
MIRRAAAELARDRPLAVALAMMVMPVAWLYPDAGDRAWRDHYGWRAGAADDMMSIGVPRKNRKNIFCYAFALGFVFNIGGMWGFYQDFIQYRSGGDQEVCDHSGVDRWTGTGGFYDHSFAADAPFGAWAVVMNDSGRRAGRFR